MSAPPAVTVFGGTGFLGHNVVAHLRTKGLAVRGVLPPPVVRARPVGPSWLTVWRRVSHRALRSGPPACAGQARHRHG